MRRVAAMVAVILVIILSIIQASAAHGDLYARYNPPPERGSLFTVDICSDQYISAAVFRLDFDTALAEYRSVETDIDGSSVKAKADDAGIKIVFCDNEGVSGRLCRVTLKWVGEGSLNFTLSMLEGVDSKLNMLANVPEYSFSASFGGDDSDDGSGSSRSGSSRSGSSARSSSSARSTSSGSRSTKTYVGEDAEPEATADERGPMIDLSRPRDTEYFLLGAGSAAAAVLLVLLGFLIGRKAKNKKSSAKAEDTKSGPPGHEESGGATDIDDLIEE